MPRTCTVCTHRERIAIEEALVLGESYRSIANRFDTSHTAIVRHKQNCVAVAMAEAGTARQVETAEQILDKLSGLQDDLSRLLRKAEQSKSYAAAVSAIRETTRLFALITQLRIAMEAHGQLDPEEWRVSMHFVDSVMDRAGQILENKVKCPHCAGNGYVDKPVLALPPAPENGFNSLGTQPEGEE